MDNIFLGDSPPVVCSMIRGLVGGVRALVKGGEAGGVAKSVAVASFSWLDFSEAVWRSMKLV